jgi:hypothetical protein
MKLKVHVGVKSDAHDGLLAQGRRYVGIARAQAAMNGQSVAVSPNDEPIQPKARQLEPPHSLVFDWVPPSSSFGFSRRIYMFLFRIFPSKTFFRTL